MSRRASRAPGRRVGPRLATTTGSTQPDRRGLLLGVAAAALTLVLLALAAALPHVRTEDGAVATARHTSVGSEMVCLGGLPNARWRAGVAGPGTAGLTVDGVPLRRSRDAALRAPVVVRAPAASASDAWATQSASAGLWFAAATCPTPRADWWFPGAGGATRHRGVLELTNPRDGDAIVDVSVLGPHGVVPTPGLRGIRVASRRTVRLDLAKVAAAYGDLAVRVTATRGLIAAAVPERWSASVVSRSVREWVPGQPTAGRRLTLLGIGGKHDQATLVVGNPSARAAVVTVQLLTDGGVVAPKDHASVTVPPGTVRAVALPSAPTAGALGVEVTSQVPVTATVRSVHGSDEAYAVAAEPLGADAVVGVPAGSTGSLVLSADQPTAVTVRSYDAAGRMSDSRSVTVPGRGATTTRLPRHAAAVRIAGAEGAQVRASLVLESGGGLAVTAVPATAVDAKVPPVVPVAP